ncbi:MAG: hypothetical protein QXK07_07900 [Desulfurococcaceae archaeon]
MKVKYKINMTIYNALLDIFHEAKEVEDTYDMAKIIITDNETVYLTCCKNEWFVGYDGQNYYFGYRGTRNGFARAQPFYDSKYHVPRFYLKYPTEPHLESKAVKICIRKDYVSDIGDDDDVDVEKSTVDETEVSYDSEEGKYVKFSYICYELKKLLEYETTLPRDIVHPLDTVETLLTNEKIAVVLHGKYHKYPLLVVEYKNMYAGKRGDEQ